MLHEFVHRRGRVPAFAVALGALEGPEPLLARVHSSCVTSEVLGACDCDCAAQLGAALAAIAEAGRGVLFYLCQEGRGAGLAAKARDRMLVQASGDRITTFDAYDRMGIPHDSRDYADVASMCALLGVRAPLHLLSNNPDKLRGLEKAGVSIEATRPLVTGPSGFNEHYLEAKRRSGHALGAGRRTSPTDLPRAVVERQPTAHAANGAFLHVAAYWLPVSPSWGRRDDDTLWIEAQLWADLDRGGERLVLVGRDGPEGAGGWLRQEWRDRLPLRTESPARGVYRRWLEEIARTRRGSIGLLQPGEQQPPPGVTDLLRRPLPAAG